MAAKVVKFSDFQVSKIQFDVFERTKTGAKLIKVSYGPNKDRILIQTPIFRLPFGLQEYPENGKPPSLSFEASLDQDRPDVVAFMDLMAQIEKAVQAHCKPMARELFGNNTSADMVASLFKTTMRCSNPEKYAPLLKIKIPQYVVDEVELREAEEEQQRRHGETLPLNPTLRKTQPRFFNAAKQEVRMDDFRVKHCEAMFIVNISSVWFVNKSFGISIKLDQARLMKTANVSKYGFHDDDDDDHPPTNGNGNSNDFEDEPEYEQE
jgi:hypothetical protein